MKKTTPERRKSMSQVAAAPANLPIAMDSTPNPVGELPGDSIRDDEIARRAYELFEQRGREPGREWEDWLQAERELRAGS
jgi:hypothetical protein